MRIKHQQTNNRFKNKGAISIGEHVLTIGEKKFHQHTVTLMLFLFIVGIPDS